MKTALTGGIAICGALLLCWYAAAQTPAAPPLNRDSPALPLDGPALYKSYCAVCHGSVAKGDGPMAKALVAKTPDLTRIAQRHGGKFPRAQIEDVISGQGALAAGHGPREMPVWGPVFSQVDRDVDLGRVRVDNLARYLESLQVK